MRLKTNWTSFLRENRIGRHNMEQHWKRLIEQHEKLGAKRDVQKTYTTMDENSHFT